MSTRHPITASVRRRLVLWVALVAAGTLLALAARGAGPLPGDLALTRLLQELPPDGVAGSLLSRAGGMVWVLLAVAFLMALLGRRWRSALFVMLAGVTGVLVGVVLKLPVVRPRPSVGLVQVYEPAGGYSFPSATALLAVIALGMICYLIRQERPPRPVVVASVSASYLLVLVIGLSRVYVGEHWATDVVGGWLFGGAWLILLVAVHRRWFEGRANRRGRRDDLP